MLTSIFGLKESISQRFTRDGRRVPVTVVNLPPMLVTQLKTPTTDGYWAVRLAVGVKSPKNITRPAKGQLRGADKAPLFFRETDLAHPDIPSTLKIGDQILASSILTPGELVDVQGISKGKGFAGGVKRYHFKGGPRTHGQSDRERAPGSIGSTTTPGRVYKGKRMAGRLGHDQVTVKNLIIFDVTERQALIGGVIPGHIKGLIKIKKTGKTAKNFEPLLTGSETLDKEAIASKQEEMAKSLGGSEEGSKTAEAIKKALESQKKES